MLFDYGFLNWRVSEIIWDSPVRILYIYLNVTSLRFKIQQWAQRTKVKDAWFSQIPKVQVSLGHNPSSWYSTLRHPVGANGHGAHLGWLVPTVVHFTKWLCPLHNPSFVKKREILDKLLYTKKQRTTSSGDQMRILGEKISGIFIK